MAFTFSDVFGGKCSRDARWWRRKSSLAAFAARSCDALSGGGWLLAHVRVGVGSSSEEQL